MYLSSMETAQPSVPFIIYFHGHYCFHKFAFKITGGQPLDEQLRLMRLHKELSCATARLSYILCMSASLPPPPLATPTHPPTACPAGLCCLLKSCQAQAACLDTLAPAPHNSSAKTTGRPCCQHMTPAGLHAGYTAIHALCRCLAASTATWPFCVPGMNT